MTADYPAVLGDALGIHKANKSGRRLSQLPGEWQYPFVLRSCLFFFFSLMFGGEGPPARGARSRQKKPPDSTSAPSVVGEEGRRAREFSPISRAAAEAPAAWQEQILAQLAAVSSKQEDILKETGEIQRFMLQLKGRVEMVERIVQRPDGAGTGGRGGSPVSPPPSPGRESLGTPLHKVGARVVEKDRTTPPSGATRAPGGVPEASTREQLPPTPRPGCIRPGRG